MYAFSSHNGLLASKHFFGAEKLSVEVALFEDVAVDDAQMADAYAGECFDDRAAQSAAADDNDLLIGKRGAFLFGKGDLVAVVSVREIHSQFLTLMMTVFISVRYGAKV
jgi:hypothetical protein